MNLAAPSTFETFGRQPLYITLHEHFCYCPLSCVPCDEAENGMMNAWLPSSCRWVERGVSSMPCASLYFFDCISMLRPLFRTELKSSMREAHSKPFIKVSNLAMTWWINTRIFTTSSSRERYVNTSPFNDR